MSDNKQAPAIDIQEFFQLNSPRERILFLLKFAVLAPSTHNTQPWKVSIKDDSCRVYIDLSRQLPEADKHKRDMYISLGTFMKNLEIASKALDVYKKIEVTDQKSTHVATVYFRNLTTPPNDAYKNYRELLSALQTRSNYRGKFGKITINDKLKRELSGMCEKPLIMSLMFDKEIITELGDLTSSGLKAAYKNPRFRKEIGTRVNFNLSRKKTGIPGYSLRLPLIASFVIPKIMKVKDIGDKLAQLNYKSFVTSSGVVVISATKDDKVTWLKIGRSAQEVMIYLESKGICCSIFVAAIENEELNQKIKQAIGLKDGLKPQFLFCLGAPTLPKVYSPREAIETKFV